MAAVDPAPGFPVRVGVVDMGSNAIRLVAAEFIAPRTYTELISERLPVRLGHEVYQTGRLDPAAIAAATRAMARFGDVREELGIEHYRAVATSAVRESENGSELLSAIHDETGLRVEAISGAEEARLVTLAVRDRLELGDEPWIVADLGGGSLEVALIDRSGMLASESHTIGSVRLLEEFQDESDADRFGRLLDEYLGGLRFTLLDGRSAPCGFAATGGNMEDLALLTEAQRNDRGAAAVPLASLRRMIRKLAQLSYEERVSKLGLREDRADVILPAAMVYARLAEMAGVDTIHVPFVGLKEGVMLDLVEGVVTRSGYVDRYDREVLAGAVALGRRFLFDEAHGVHVSRLAESLFVQLVTVHRLDQDARALLVAAAVLHDIGQRISYKRHHKHSYYLISQSELPGLSSEGVEVVANVARYHRRAFPSTKHEPFAALSRESRARVASLAAILRLADALDREHRQNVEAVRAAARDTVLELAVEGRGDLALEKWAVARKSDLFEEAFDLEVQIVSPQIVSPE